jgi:hypothetical protein
MGMTKSQADEHQTRQFCHNYLAGATHASPLHKGINYIRIYEEKNWGDMKNEGLSNKKGYKKPGLVSIRKQE